MYVCTCNTSTSHRIDAVLQKGKGEWSRPASPHEDAPTIITLPWTKLVAVFAQHAIRELDPHCMVWLPWEQFHSSLKVFEAPVQWHVGVSHTTEWVDAAALAYKEERERRRWVGEGACHVICTCKAACNTWDLPTYSMG